MILYRLLIVMSMLCAVASARSDSVGAFRFVHITDTHVTPGAHGDALQRFLIGLRQSEPEPAFVVNTGDLTELGSASEYDRYRAAVAASPVPVYAVPGNHDVRWAPMGKEAFTAAVGPTFRSFNHGGCHFVLLDSTVLLEHWGHFDGAQLRWLADDLKHAPRGMPVFVFFHHWFGRDDPNIDNSDALMRVLAGYPLAAVFVGHGHSELHWRVNGIDFFMARGLYQESWHEVDVAPDSVRVTRVRPGGNRILVATIGLKSLGRTQLVTGWEDPDIELLTRRRIGASLRTLGRSAYSGAKAEFAVGTGAWRPMAATPPIRPGDRRDEAQKQPDFLGEFETKDLPSGWLTASVRVTAADGAVYTGSEGFATERVTGTPRCEWRFASASSIQGSAALAGAIVVVGSHDGGLYGIGARDGKRRWRLAAKGPFVGSPACAGGIVYAASLDHCVYAVDQRDGRLVWRYDTGSPVFASPAVMDGVLCVGGNRWIYGLDVRTGAELWKTPAGGFFQSRAAADARGFYLGGWDNTLYALDAQTGRVRWSQRMGRTDGGRGSLSFYYSPAIASPAVGDGRVIVCTDDGVLHALDATSGAELWTQRAPKGRDIFGYSSPALAAGRIYVGGLGANGDCYAVDAATGAIVWRIATGAENYDSSPCLVDGLVAIGSVQGRIFWLTADLGAIVHSYGIAPGYCFSSPVGEGKRFWIPSMNGSVSCVQLP